MSRVDPRRVEVGHLEILDVEQQRESTSKNLKVTQKLAPLLSIMKLGETDIAARSISQTGLGMVDAAPLHRGLTSHDPFHSHGRAFSKGVFKKFNRTRGRGGGSERESRRLVERLAGRRA